MPSDISRPNHPDRVLVPSIRDSKAREVFKFKVEKRIQSDAFMIEENENGNQR